MKIYSAEPICGGKVTAPVFRYTRTDGIPEVRTISDVKSEQGRFLLAKHIAQKELALLYERAGAELGSDAAMIFYIHQLMIDDDDIQKAVLDEIADGHTNAEAAVFKVCGRLCKLFGDMSDKYMSARRADISDISGRLIAILQNSSQSYPELTSPAILLCDDLTPSEILLPEKGLIKGIIMTAGTPNSHASMLARKMNIPAVCGAQLDPGTVPEACKIFLDADCGKFYITDESAPL